MAEARLHPFTVGIDNVSDETALPAGAVRDAVNVDFDSDGIATRRPGAALVEAGVFHSLWRGKGRAFCVRGNTLCHLAGGVLTPISTLPSAERLSYCELNDRIIVSNPSWIGEVLPDLTVRALGVPDGALGNLASGGTGGLPAGRYAVAAAYLRGDEEGALSDVRFVEVAEGGGIVLSDIPQNDEADTVRIYRSAPGGDVLYRAEDIPAALTSYTHGLVQLGRAVHDMHLRRTPPGSIVRSWNGRLLIARGRVMCVTEPLRFGVYSPRRGFIQEPSPITMIAPVTGGIYVGTRAGISFYKGGSPKEWVRVRLGAEAPIPGSDTNTAADIFNPRFEVGSTLDVALWLSPSGYVMGTPDGALIRPQSSRIGGLLAQRSHTTIFGRKAISVVQ